jgi:hypothetical protein
VLLPLPAALALVAAGSYLLRGVLRGPPIRDASSSPSNGNTLPTCSALAADRYGIVAAPIIESFIFRDAHYEDHPKRPADGLDACKHRRGRHIRDDVRAPLCSSSARRVPLSPSAPPVRPHDT